MHHYIIGVASWSTRCRRIPSLESSVQRGEFETPEGSARLRACTHGHLYAEQFEQSTLLARKSVTLMTHGVRICQGGNPPNKTARESEGAELRLHGMRKGVARGRVGIWSQDGS